MRILGLAAILVLASLSVASADPVCKPSPRVGPVSYPGAAKIPTGNNLLLPAGKSVSAEGQRLLITARVVDTRCMPIPNATVELWQPTPFGKWRLAGPDDLVTPNPTFAGAGRTYSDGDGEFTFITAFPAPGDGHSKAPHVHLRVLADGIADFTTILYFANDARNAQDELYKKSAPADRGGVALQMSETAQGDLLGTTTIVLPGKAKYRTY